MAAGGNPQLQYYLGMVLLRSGDAPAAQQALASAVRTADARGLVFKGLEDARTALARLANPAAPTAGGAFPL